MKMQAKRYAERELKEQLIREDEQKKRDEMKKRRIQERDDEQELNGGQEEDKQKDDSSLNSLEPSFSIPSSAESTTVEVSSDDCNVSSSTSAAIPVPGHATASVHSSPSLNIIVPSDREIRERENEKKQERWRAEHTASLLKRLDICPKPGEVIQKSTPEPLQKDSGDYSVNGQSEDTGNSHLESFDIPYKTVPKKEVQILDRTTHTSVQSEDLHNNDDIAEHSDNVDKVRKSDNANIRESEKVVEEVVGKEHAMFERKNLQEQVKAQELKTSAPVGDESKPRAVGIYFEPTKEVVKMVKTLMLASSHLDYSSARREVDLMPLPTGWVRCHTTEGREFFWDESNSQTSPMNPNLMYLYRMTKDNASAKTKLKLAVKKIGMVNNFKLIGNNAMGKDYSSGEAVRPHDSIKAQRSLPVRNVSNRVNSTKNKPYKIKTMMKDTGTANINLSKSILERNMRPIPEYSEQQL